MGGPEQYTYHPPPPQAMETKSGDSEVLFEGETWDACPLCCICCVPLCCNATKYKITKHRIDKVSGCCGSQEDTMDMRRIQDVSFRGNCCTELLCCGRGTVFIESTDPSDPSVSLTYCCHETTPRELYRLIRDAWSKAKIATAVYEG
eukprot:TRINITY_DN2999_c1_g2_i1.p1 TRINITY_DN2999_c1_g2~~TRINITY_DN2999_c1_g2_i1.p1  ORF type:complete len:147 (-),score=20.66 TRINITY_DN2999_c1_g2_i1:227-667(-)